jgi:hypothetical protein
MTEYNAAKRSMAAFALLLSAAAASAQPSATPGKPGLPTENVTVSGTKSREVIQDFVNAFAARTQLIDKIARWETGICPITEGLPLRDSMFVTQRLKDVAAAVGAPVSADKTCKHNIEIIFTRTPQALLDNVKKDNENFLGYHDNAEQRDRLATVTHPIQAWYTTATQDVNGYVQVDMPVPGPGLPLPVVCRGRPGICTVYLPSAKMYGSTGNRLNSGLRSDFYNIIIAVDISKVGQRELDSVSDYIALLALTQPSSLDICPPLSSIVSLLAKDCEDHAVRLTTSDMNYLQGLYKMNPEMTAGIQHRQIADQMVQALPEK